jgi:alpha-amylase/alpha-mannosidase (GH57 family)
VSQTTPIRVAILWHMHQPDYREPNSNRLSMPWVRLHALKDYLDMPLRAGTFESLRLTFNLVPSLLDQLEAYTRGAVDRHLELSRLPADSLNPAQKAEILDTFFAGNPVHMINPYPRYRQLYDKAKQGTGAIANQTALFSSSEIRDLQVWSNLSWVDPFFRDEAPVRMLFARERHFTEEDKQALLDWEIRLIGRIVPVYRRLQDDGQIEVSFTPYYHPILPLLCDTNIAREALPSIKLPGKRFAHPEDAQRQIALSAEKYEALFGRPLAGMWPSEGSVSEQAVEIAASLGIRWMATDEEILYQSLTKSGLDRSAHPLHTVYAYRNGIRMLFRDHALSDRIGFVYAGWEAERAVSDFVEHIHGLRTLLADQLERVVVPIVLDGENAWEYFANDGAEFLTRLYTALTSDPEIKTVTFSEAVSAIEPRPLPSIFAGSWINHSFSIWIGHDEDNTAWDLLSQARTTLAEFERAHPDFDRSRLDAAWNQIYVAEGSDWCWWYGDDHRTLYRDQFDRTYRRHLMAVYEALGLTVPAELERPIFERQVSSFIHPPDQMVTPIIDGRLTHYYEWAGAGHFDCLRAGGAMHRAAQRMQGIFFAYDRDRIYIRLDFIGRGEVESVRDAECVITLEAAEQKRITINAGRDGAFGEYANYEYAVADILELAVDRKSLWPQGFGQLGVAAGLYEAGQQVEQWPEDDMIRLLVPEPHAEIVWPI